MEVMQATIVWRQAGELMLFHDVRIRIEELVNDDRPGFPRDLRDVNLAIAKSFRI